MNTPNTPAQSLAWIDAHGGSTDGWQCSATYARATGSMEGWSAHLGLDDARHADLSKHIQCPNGHTLMLSISPSGEGPTPIRWGSVLKVGDGRWVRVYGHAPDFPAALEAATSYRHESRQIGALTWWLETGGLWVSWLGGLSMRAHPVTSAAADESDRWYFETYGNAPTLEEAALLASMRHA